MLVNVSAAAVFFSNLGGSKTQIRAPNVGGNSNLVIRRKEKRDAFKLRLIIQEANIMMVDQAIDIVTSTTGSVVLVVLKDL